MRGSGTKPAPTNLGRHHGRPGRRSVGRGRATTSGEGGHPVRDPGRLGAKTVIFSGQYKFFSVLSFPVFNSFSQCGCECEFIDTVDVMLDILCMMSETVMCCH